MKTWKITNVAEKPVKISAAISSTQAPGVILQKGQFCLSNEQMTSHLHKQSQAGLVTIEEGYENPQNLDLAKAYDESDLDKIQAKTKEYTK